VAAAPKLKNHFVTDEHRNLKGSVATRILGPLQERCNQAGTSAVRFSGQAFNLKTVVDRREPLKVPVNDAIPTAPQFTI